MTEGDLISLDSDSQNYGRKKLSIFNIFPDFSYMALRIFYTNMICSPRLCQLICYNEIKYPSLGVIGLTDDTENSERIHQKILKWYIGKYNKILQIVGLFQLELRFLIDNLENYMRK